MKEFFKFKNSEKTKTRANNKTKIFSVALLCIMCCVCVFSVCLFGGCGNNDVSIATLKETFAELDKQNDELAQNKIFVSGVLGGVQTDYVISYAETGNNIVENFVILDTNFGELRQVYNRFFAQTNAYLDKSSQARNLVLAFEDKDLSGAAHSALNSLNSAVLDYLAFVPKFLQQRTELLEHAKLFSQQPDFGAEYEYTYLRAFKRDVMQPLVQKSLAASTALANAVQQTKVFEILQGQILPEDSQTLAEYVKMKLLPLYSRLRLEEIASQMFWQELSEQENPTQTFLQVNNILLDAEEQFSKILKGFSFYDGKTLSKQEVQRVQNLTDLLLQDAQTYYAALDGIDLKDYATFDGTAAEYLSRNSYANTHLQTIETFWNYTIPAFLDTVDAIF